MSRLLTTAGVFTLGAVALGGSSVSLIKPPAASAAVPEAVGATVHHPLLRPVKLDRKNAQLRLVQVVFRWVQLAWMGRAQVMHTELRRGL